MTDFNPLNTPPDLNLTSDPLVETAAPDAETTAVLLDASPTGVAHVTINRPHRGNAFDQTTIAALREAFETLHGADQVRMVFVRGAGGTFCSGPDIEWMRDSVDWTEADNRDDAYQLARMLKVVHDVPVLTVALVEGAAVGGGAGLVAACDVAIAVRTTKFAFSEVTLGLTPAVISPYVVDAIGPRNARALFCAGAVFDADRAFAIGLVQEVVDDAAALEAAQARLVGQIMAAAPGAARETRRLVQDVHGRAIDDGLMQDTARRFARRRVSAEAQEGLKAFLETRRPDWAT